MREKKIILTLLPPYDLIPEYKEKLNFAQKESGDFPPENSLSNVQSPIWSQLLNAARTYFESIQL
jgi:hypothetical protein